MFNVVKLCIKYDIFFNIVARRAILVLNCGPRTLCSFKCFLDGFEFKTPVLAHLFKKNLEKEALVIRETCLFEELIFKFKP
jgi:hypothetical protein